MKTQDIDASPRRTFMTHAMTRRLRHAAGAALLLIVPINQVSAAAKTSISLGADSGSGDYGTRDSTTTTTIPFAIKHETGDWTFRASLRSCGS